MFDVSAFFSGLVALAKKSPLFFIVFLIVVAVFLAAPFLAIYRKLTALPVVGSVLPQK